MYAAVQRRVLQWWLGSRVRAHDTTAIEHDILKARHTGDVGFDYRGYRYMCFGCICEAVFENLSLSELVFDRSVHVSSIIGFNIMYETEYDGQAILVL